MRLPPDAAVPGRGRQDERRARGHRVQPHWGATVSGETVIRRSAIGVDKTGQGLFYGLGEAVTAQALARAMRAAGARPRPSST